jgi:hypothetical protein
MLKNIIKFYSPVFFFSLIVTALSVVVYLSLGSQVMIDNIGGVGLFISFLGTIYTLISAFIIAEVWGQFNGMGEMLSSEAKSISAIWDNIDYLNDQKISEGMRKVLSAYIERLMQVEISEASKLVRSIHPSDELKAIHKVIDEIKFDDGRDSSIYPALIADYETLSSIRAKRIEAGLSRIPLFLKSLLIILTFILILSFVFLGFSNILLYSACVFFVSLISSLIYKVVVDLDSPYEGIWNIDTNMLSQSLKYIKESKQAA